MPKFYLYILSIFLCFVTFAEAKTFVPTEAFQAIIDTEHVLQDNTNVKPRSFENLKEKYDSSAYEYEKEKTDGWFTRLGEWIENKFQQWFNLKSRASASKLLDNLLNIFYVIIVIVVVFLIVKAIMNGEGRWVFGKSSDKKIIQFEDVETNIHEVDFDALISNAVSERNYRLALRYKYLNILKKMSAAELIAYDPEKTNLDYVNELQNDTLKEQFQYTSYLYNYVWYGEFDIDQQQFDKAEQSFSTILKSIAA